MKVRWTDVLRAGTNFQTAPGPRSSVQLAQAWVPVGLINLTMVNDVPQHSHVASNPEEILLSSAHRSLLYKRP